MTPVPVLYVLPYLEEVSKLTPPLKIGRNPKRKQSSNHFSGVMLASGRGKDGTFPSRMVGQKAEVTGISGMNGTYSRPY